MAQEVSHTYYNLSDPGLRNTSTASFDFVEYRTDDVSLGLTSESYEINHKDLDSWVLPSDSYLQVQCRVQKTSDGSAFAAADLVALQNNGFNLFDRCDYILDSQTLESVNYAGQTTLVNGLMSLGDDYRRTYGEQMLFLPDTAGGAADLSKFNTTTVDSTANGGNDAVSAYTGVSSTYNLGFAQRHAVCNGSGSHKQINLMLPLKHLFGFAEIGKVFRGVRHTLRLRRNSFANMIFRSGAVAADVLISKISWFVPIVRPSLSQQLILEKTLASGAGIPLNFNSVETVRSGSYTAGTSNESWRVTATAARVARVFVAFQLGNKVGDQTTNSMVFDNIDLERLHVRVNSIQFPRDELQMTYTSGSTSPDWARAYVNLMSYQQKMYDGQAGGGVSYTDFGSIYPIYHFDTSDVEESAFQSSDIEIRWEPRNAPSGAYNVYCFIHTEREAVLTPLDQGRRLRLEM